MRIKELADLTDTTVRTVRYYHQIGLLPIPQVRFGARDYDMVHVARLVRIRWLTQAGIALPTIAGMLAGADPGRPSILADLHATLDGLDGQLADLHRRREHIGRLVALVEQDGGLTPMPPAVSRFYDHMETRATDERVRRVIRRERDFMELAFYRGDMPPEAAVVYDQLTDSRLAESLALFGAVADRSDPEIARTDQEIDQLAATVVDQLVERLDGAAPRLFAAVDLTVARRAAELFLRLSDPSARRLDRAIADALLTAIEKAQKS